MQKILTGDTVKDLDQAYVSGENISSFQLMERAANAFCDWFKDQFSNKPSIAVFCGKGNNGGDGLAIARLLFQSGHKVHVFTIGDTQNGSEDFIKNLGILPETIPLVSWENAKGLETDIIIDGVFGVGINRPLAGEYLELIQLMNSLEATKIAIDLPSGLPADALIEGEAFNADHTVSFQLPKLSLLVPEHVRYTGELHVKSIGIGPAYFEKYDSTKYFFSGENLLQLHKRFHRFSHKGDFGKVMLAGGSYGKIGAVCLAASAALRTGSGLVFAFVPRCGVEIVQTALPEVMAMASDQEEEISATLSFEKIDAVGIGPGIGTGDHASQAVYQVLSKFKGSTVLDADALNLLSSHKSWYKLLHEKVILTPHLIEFERLAGPCEDHFERMEKARSFAMEHGCTLVLKGANTLISFPDGQQVFNSSGTHFMATGGSGDVLTGMLTSLLGQGYGMKAAAICGVFHHGHAGELSGQKRGRGTIASDLIASIPKSFKYFRVD